MQRDFYIQLYHQQKEQIISNQIKTTIFGYLRIIQNIYDFKLKKIKKLITQRR